jgi:RNA polymerase sigma factor (TIGR02999 family)
MKALHTTHFSELLRNWRKGDKQAGDELMKASYEELHRLAAQLMRHERPDHTLQATALVNELFLKLMQTHSVRYASRKHFYAFAAKLMRMILVDHARARRCQKRGGLAAKVTFDEALVVTDEPGLDFVALDDALEALAQFDERKSRVIEMRFFGGLSVEETAVALNVSPATVMGDWRLAKAWLKREMRGDRSHDA